ncbi:MAG: hypothetical protein J5875_09055 [Paludibacteraceae bacterium]|nr:hypothetical protein [Paludibacteraceae bacterium]
MNKKILIALALIGGSFCANAAVRYMTVEQKTGEKFSFLLMEKPVVTFSEGNLVVNGSAATSYAISGVKNYHFTDDDQSGVEIFGADVLRIVEVDDNKVRVENAQAGTQVLLFNASGVLLVDAVVDQTGSAVVTLPEQKGVYVLAADKKSIKLIRK